MSVLYELIKAVLEGITEFVGIEGLAIGVLAATTVALWYLREAADLFVIIARYARILSLIGFVLLLVMIGGTTTGVVEFDGVGQLLGSIADKLTEVVNL